MLQVEVDEPVDVADIGIVPLGMLQVLEQLQRGEHAVIVVLSGGGGFVQFLEKFQQLQSKHVTVKNKHSKTKKQQYSNNQ